MRDGAPVHGHTGLEIFWTAIPTMIVIFFARLGRDRARHERGARQRDPHGRRARLASTPGSSTTRARGFKLLELVLPIDVHVAHPDAAPPTCIHSFYVAEWRVKQDAVPGGKDVARRVTPTRWDLSRCCAPSSAAPGHAAMSTTNRRRVVSRCRMGPVGRRADRRAPRRAGRGQPRRPGPRDFDRPRRLRRLPRAAGRLEPPARRPGLDNVAEADAEAAGEHRHAFVRESIIDPDAAHRRRFRADIMPKNYGEQLDAEQLDDLVNSWLWRRRSERRHAETAHGDTAPAPASGGAERAFVRSGPAGGAR